MIIKKFIFFNIFLLSSCGYDSNLFKKKAINISIKKIELKGNKNVK